jgi:CxxC motif-containing protein (DUF1111 family)
MDSIALLRRSLLGLPCTAMPRLDRNGLRCTVVVRWWTALLVALTSACGTVSAAVADDEVELGRTLFEHKWVVDDPVCSSGDGLGPMRNADSCVACHNLGGSGGAGSAEHNVDLLSFVPGKDAVSNSKLLSALRSRAGKVHPDFVRGAATIVFHKFSTEPRYERLRLEVLGFKLPGDLQSDRAAVVRRNAAEKQLNGPPVSDLSHASVPFRLTHRNTPSLFGAGLIDLIPNETLLDLAKQQSERSPQTAGRPARPSGKDIGRFGWRGQVATLHEFVVSACAIELGLQNPKHPQSKNPLDSKRSPDTGDDLTADQCTALVAYVASLPAPARSEPADRKEAERFSHGEKIFESCGCSACHVRDVGDVHGIYSDLLLHDMGSTLEETIPSSSAAYYGVPTAGSLADRALQPREWKTPPLWGLRDSAPYLHDGRARTLVDAITAHGGQAEASVNKFKSLEYLSRSHLLDFLNSLGRPSEKSESVAGL